MRLSTPSGPHLTYCTNIHPGERWPEVRANLERFVLPVRERVAPERAFGIGLRLGAAAAADLGRPAALARFRGWLGAHGLYVFTINGFPYGPFHGRPVKERVYLPDWLDPARLAYTDQLAEILAALLPEGEGIEGTISTVPGAFAPNVTGSDDAARIADRLAAHAATLHRIREQTGRQIALALEPEPCCYLETATDAADFFEHHVFGAAGVERLQLETQLPSSVCGDILRRHLGVCLDTCHMAVEWEDPDEALGALERAGVRVAKLQISAGLQADFAGDPAADHDIADALRAFADSVYLHQVVERRVDGEFRRYLDLPDALDALRRSPGEPRDWRIHFHVPLFRERLGAFRSTQEYAAGMIRRFGQAPRTAHWEVETYTWDVLPAEFRAEGVVVAVARELRWVREQAGE